MAELVEQLSFPLNDEVCLFYQLFFFQRSVLQEKGLLTIISTIDVTNPHCLEALKQFRFLYTKLYTTDDSNPNRFSLFLTSALIGRLIRVLLKSQDSKIQV